MIETDQMNDSEVEWCIAVSSYKEQLKGLAAFMKDFLRYKNDKLPDAAVVMVVTHIDNTFAKLTAELLNTDTTVTPYRRTLLEDCPELHHMFSMAQKIRTEYFNGLGNIHEFVDWDPNFLEDAADELC